MKTIELIKIKDCSDLIKKSPTKNDYNKVINEDCLFIKNNKPVGIYLKIKNDMLSRIRKACISTKYVKTYRARRAIPTQSSVFGSLPRVPLRNDYCRYSVQSKKERNNYEYLFEFSLVLVQLYKQYLPEQLIHDLNVIKSTVNADYLPKDNSPFTTANINVNHAIKYHRDTGNFKGNLSNVLILKDGIIGGELVFPEYGFALSQEDSFLSIFDGQGEIHGVMPIAKTKENSYRASIVYYTLENMKHCYPFKEELKRIQNLSTIRANKRSLGIDPRSTVV